MPNDSSGQSGLLPHSLDNAARIPVVHAQRLRKPEWIRSKLPGTRNVRQIITTLRENLLHTVCEEANCPNRGECFDQRTATFLIMGAVCTRRCPFCDIGHGRPLSLDVDEPKNLAQSVADMALKHVVITSVTRDDLRDGGARHFADCIREVRRLNPGVSVEILTPDFRGRDELALSVLATELPDVFNHNIETVPRLYKVVRPGADYLHSLALLARVKDRHPELLTKSGLMLGLGERFEEIEAALADLCMNGVDMVTIGQYLQPSLAHLPVQRYVPPVEFEALKAVGERMGFRHVASGPMVRSSYHAAMHARTAGAV